MDENQIKAVFKMAETLQSSMQRIIPALSDKKPLNPELFLKIARPLSVTVENTLPQLRDFADTLEYMQRQAEADKLRALIVKLEEESLPPILTFLNQHAKTVPAQA